MQIKRPSKIILTLALLNLVFNSCEAKASMEFSRDLPRRETAEYLREGNISFLLGMDPSRMNDLAGFNPSAPFYAGLLVESAGDKVRSARLFEAALGSPVSKIKSEAARKLIPMLAEPKDREQAGRILTLVNKEQTPNEEFIILKGAALYVLGRNREVLSFFESPVQRSSGRKTAPDTAVSLLPERAMVELNSWKRAFRFLSALMQQQPEPETLQELRSFLFDSPVNAAYRWAYAELQNLESTSQPGDRFWTAAEKAAAAGRLAVLEQAFSSALLHFSSVRNADTPLFFHHTSLLADMGRAYIGVASRREEGFKLFTDWETATRTGRNSPITATAGRQALSTGELDTGRYNLLFYAGRIRRQQGRHGEARQLFTRALSLAPNTAQEDACIRYILSSAFTENPETVPALIKTYGNRWHTYSDFHDILDRLCAYLVTNGKWNDLAEVFSVLRNGKDGAMISRYAYLAGRAVSLGYLPSRNMSARDYYAIAYEEGNTSFYYRSLAASYLNRTVVPVTSQNQHPGPRSFPNGNELEFYVKFFEYGASSYAMPYVRENASRYTGPELRVLSRTFAASGRYLESIQITGIHMRRDNYVMNTEDLELYYPKPFQELIERQSRANNIHPSVFLGLVRTESAFMPSIASHAGAVGLSQVMPATAREVAAVIKRRGGPDYAADGEIDLTNPEINVHLGAVYLRDLNTSLGSPMLALLGYNAGPGRIRRIRRESPNLPEDLFIETIAITETRNYGKRVMAAAAAYGYLYYGMSMHEVVTSIFK
jgi:soluble lytic murein transglycosylase